jgi:acyl carrier protein
MTVTQRILKCLNEITDAVPERDEPLQSYGLDSLDIMDLLYGIEREFDMRNTFDMKLCDIKSVSIGQIEALLERAITN